MKVFNRLHDAGLRLKPTKCKLAPTKCKLAPTKCKLAQKSVEYLGHVVSDQGIQTDPKKLQAVNGYPTPTNVKSLRSFLGLASYYRRLIPNFAKVAGPLYVLMKKDVEFTWPPVCQEAFERLRKLLASAPVLAYPDLKYRLSWKQMP